MAQYTNLSRLQSRLNVVFLGEARRGLSVHVYPTVFDCTNVVASAIERLVIMIDFLLLKSIIVIFWVVYFLKVKGQCDSYCMQFAICESLNSISIVG